MQTKVYLKTIVFISLITAYGKMIEIYVWNYFIRIFHWLLFALCVVMYFTSKYGDITLHTAFGYILTILLIIRIIYGFLSSNKYAKFKNFILSPKYIFQYLAIIATNNIKKHRYTGHNPAGGAMIVLLITTLIISIITGIITLAVIEFERPLAVLLLNMSNVCSYLFRDFHRLIFDILLILIILHIAGVLIASWQRQENLIKAMITGKKNKL